MVALKSAICSVARFVKRARLTNVFRIDLSNVCKNHQTVKNKTSVRRSEIDIQNWQQEPPLRRVQGLEGSELGGNLS